MELAPKQVLPSSVVHLLSRLLQTVAPSRPADARAACTAAGRRVDHVCVRAMGEGLKGSGRSSLARNGSLLERGREWLAFEPASGARCREAGGSAHDPRRLAALAACTSQTAVLLGADTELARQVQLPSLLSSGWSAVLVAWPAQNAMQLARTYARYPRVHVVHGAWCTARGARSAPLFFVNASGGAGSNDSDVRCLGDGRAAELQSFSRRYLQRQQLYFRPHTPQSCRRCSEALRRPLPPACMRNVVEANLLQVEVECTAFGELLRGVSRIGLLAARAPGALASAIAGFPFASLLPRRVMLASLSLEGPSARSGIKQRLAGAGYQQHGSALIWGGLQAWELPPAAPPAAASPPPPPSRLSQFTTRLHPPADGPAAPVSGKCRSRRADRPDPPGCRPFCTQRFARAHCTLCKCVACTFCKVAFGRGHLSGRH